MEQNRFVSIKQYNQAHIVRFMDQYIPIHWIKYARREETYAFVISSFTKCIYVFIHMHADLTWVLLGTYISLFRVLNKITRSHSSLISTNLYVLKLISNFVKRISTQTKVVIFLFSPFKTLFGCTDKFRIQKDKIEMQILGGKCKIILFTFRAICCWYYHNHFSLPLHIGI